MSFSDQQDAPRSMFSRGSNLPALQLVEPRDVDVYTFRQRLAKLTVDSRQRASEHGREAQGYKWLYFLCGLVPGAFLSCSTSLFCAGWKHDEISHRDTVIMCLGISNAIVVAMAGFWNWQGTAEKHSRTAKAFQRIHTKAEQMNITWEQNPSLGSPDYDSLNRLYADVGRIYEEAPILGFRASRSLASNVTHDTAAYLRRIDEEERTEEGVARFRNKVPGDSFSQMSIAKLAIQGKTLKLQDMGTRPNEEIIGLRSEA
jgi:hypothetical protein